ncbi:small ribosomal subunit protein uS9m [Lithobates pipiens]
MAAVCRSRGLAVVQRSVGICAWRPGVAAYGEVSRLIHTSYAVQRKNVAASGPEKYTEAFIKKQIEEFNIGKRHLANMMGEDPETFTQEDIDKAIAYLFPSGLFEKKARPVMKHPDDIFPKQLAIQWGEDKRPFHFLFYTGKQEFYSLMHDTHEMFLKVQAYGDEVVSKGLNAESTGQVEMIGRNWISKEELEEAIVEKVSDKDYQYFIQTMERLVRLPHSSIEEEYVHKFCKKLEIQSKKQMVNTPQHDEHGRAFSTAKGMRKTSQATVILRDNGKGNITINGEDYLDYFTVLQDREQLMFPFQFVDGLRKYDAECTVSEGGRSSQAGSIRLAISRALLSFVSEGYVEAMRQAGLLTVDPRKRERKKPGQEGARRKFTWMKR